MGFGLKEVLIVLSVLVLVVVIIDAVRRLLEYRHNQVKLSNRLLMFDDENIDELSQELPRGGARIRQDSMSDEIEDILLSPGKNKDDNLALKAKSTINIGKKQANDSHSDNKLETKEALDNLQAELNAKQDQLEENSEITIKATEKENIDEAIDALEKRNAEREEIKSFVSKKEHYIKAKAQLSSMQKDLFGLYDEPSPQLEPASQESSSGESRKTKNDTPKKTKQKQTKSLDIKINTKGYKKYSEPLTENEIEEKKEITPDQVIVINVMAKKGEKFEGEKLLKILLAMGLRYGDMKIFHRHEQPNGFGKILFSLASAVNPGTFKLDEMKNMESPGLTLFMQLGAINKRMKVFELMFDVAARLAKQLDGELRDDTQSAMTVQTYEHYKQKVIDFDYKKKYKSKYKQSVFS